MDMSRPRIQLSIGRLVLKGFRADQREAIVAALGRELRRQLGQAGSSESLGGSRSLANLGTVPATTVSAHAPGVGEQAARQLVGGLRR